MTNVLLEYIRKGHNEAQKEKQAYKPKPIITISREYGCPSAETAGLLCEKINHELFSKNAPAWRWVNKEVLEKSSSELNLEPEKIEYIFDNEQRSAVDEILAAFSNKYYKSDRKIRKTIQEVIETIAYQGNAIIVGRGGVAITRDHPNALHIRLSAPLEWRTERISKKYSLTEKEAKKRILDLDKKRLAFIGSFLKQEIDYSLFDLVINCKTFEPNEASALIFDLMHKRKMI